MTTTNSWLATILAIGVITLLAWLLSLIKEWLTHAHAPGCDWIGEISRPAGLKGRPLTHHILGEITRMEPDKLLEILEDDRERRLAAFWLDRPDCAGLVLLQECDIINDTPGRQRVVPVMLDCDGFDNWEAVEKRGLGYERAVAYCESK